MDIKIYDIVRETNRMINVHKKLILYSTATHGSNHLFKCIEVVAWLCEQDDIKSNYEYDIVSAEIVMLPVNTITFTFQRIKNDIKRFLNKFLLCLKIYVGKWVFRKQAIHKKIYTNKIIYKEVYSGNTARFLNGKIECSIKLYREPSYFPVKRWLRSLLLASKLWRTCFKKYEFIPALFLKLNWNEVHIGDLIASHTLRTNPKLGGSLKACRALFINLLHAVDIVELTKDLINDANANIYTATPEPTYLHAVHLRSLVSSGYSAIALHSYDNNEYVIPKGSSYTETLFAPTPSGEEIDLTVIDSYMHDRFFNTAKTLWYMLPGCNNNNSKHVLDLSGEIINIGDCDLTVVIFLHSFDDAQYYYGLNGFDDLYQWTTFTIDNCIANKAIHKVCIKVHPSIDYVEYPGDKIAFNKIYNKYKRKQDVVFLEKQTSLIALVNRGKIYGITHHGSVAEEIVYLGQPVIASNCAPWGNDYPFLKTWSTLGEYCQLIKSISVDRWLPPSEDELECLYKYIYEYRIKTSPIKERFCWLKYAELVNGKDVEDSSENYLKYVKEMENIRSDSILFNDFMNVLTSD